MNNIFADGGPAIGLDWLGSKEDTLRFELDTFEEFRGGIIPDVVEEDEVGYCCSLCYSLCVRQLSGRANAGME